MWKPSSLRIGLAQARLGQESTLTSRMAAAVIAQAEPRLRQVIAAERNRWADAIIVALPYTGISLATCLATTYFIPPGELTWKVGGYVASLGTFVYGIWDAADSLKEPIKPSPPTEDGVLQDVLASLVDPASRQIAQAIVEEATPRVEKIIDEERQRATDAIHAAIPWVGVAVLAALGTTFFVPATMPWAKAGGYGAATASALVGIYRGVDVSR